MIIIIPTRGRFERYHYTIQNGFFTHRKVQERYKVILAVIANEIPLYRSLYRDTLEYMTIPDDMRFSDIRQKIMEDVTTDDAHWVIDDDLSFYGIDKEAQVIRKMLVVDDMLECLKELESTSQLSDFVMGGLIDKYEVRDDVTEPKMGGKVIRNHLYRRSKILDLGIKFNAVETKQDYDSTLQLLKMGIPNHVIRKFSQGELRADKTDGGCSLYRTAEINTRVCHEMKERHGDLVKLVEKKTAVANKTGSLDITVYWKKALEYGRSLK